MTHQELSPLGREWITLQDNHEQYEKGCLLIKLFAIALCAVGFMFALHEVVMVLLLLVVWLQEGIFRTSQARLGARIMRVEHALNNADSDDGSGAIVAFQLHSEWHAARPGGLGLLYEYVSNALRPTVAFPYVALLLLIVLLVVFASR